MPSRYVLIDFENVQPEDLGPLDATPYQLRVFVGSQQTKVPTELAIHMQQLGSQASYVRVEGHGRNALDFLVAYYMGRFATEDPGSSFHVVSKDTGFDVLLEHMRQQGVECARIKSLVDLPKVSPTSPATPAEKLRAVVAHLTQMNGNKPRSLKGLRNSLKQCLGVGVADAELDALIDGLRMRAFLEVEKTKVRYASDATSPQSEFRSPG